MIDIERKRTYMLSKREQIVKQLDTRLSERDDERLKAEVISNEATTIYSVLYNEDVRVKIELELDAESNIRVLYDKENLEPGNDYNIIIKTGAYRSGSLFIMPFFIDDVLYEKAIPFADYLWSSVIEPKLYQETYLEVK